MSHSLHRQGTVENLQNDYTFYARTSRWVNREGCGPKLRRIFDIMMSAKVINFGHSEKSLQSGLTPEAYAAGLDDAYGVSGCFSDKEALKSFLIKYKQADTGISLVVSGLIDEIVALGAEIGLKPHTAFLSLGVHGKRALLPADRIMEITTMCGHGLVAAKLCAAVIAQVKSGRMTAQEGARRLAQPCPCGIFNPDRAAKLLMQASSPADSGGVASADKND